MLVVGRSGRQMHGSTCRAPRAGHFDARGAQSPAGAATARFWSRFCGTACTRLPSADLRSRDPGADRASGAPRLAQVSLEAPARRAPDARKGLVCGPGCPMCARGAQVACVRPQSAGDVRLTHRSDREAAIHTARPSLRARRAHRTGGRPLSPSPAPPGRTGEPGSPPTRRSACRCRRGRPRAPLPPTRPARGRSTPTRP